MDLSQLLTCHRDDVVSTPDGNGQLIGVDLYPNRTDKHTELTVWTEPLAVIQFNRRDFDQEIWVTKFSPDHRPEYENHRDPTRRGGPSVTRVFPISQVEYIQAHDPSPTFDLGPTAPVVEKRAIIQPVVKQVWRSRRGQHDRFVVEKVAGTLVDINDIDYPGGYKRQTTADALNKQYDFVGDKL